MALFNKIFFNGSNKRKTNSTNNDQSYQSQFPFEGSQIRVLLYRECDTRGRRLLFDSSSVQKVELTANDTKDNNPQEPLATKQFTKTNGVGFKCSNNRKQSNNGIIEISDGFGYKHLRPNSSDITAIGEMVFGSLAMSFRGTTLKMHWLQTPARILCSQVFLSPVPNPNLSSGKTNSSLTSSRNRLSSTASDTASLNSFSMPFSICVKDNLSIMAENMATHPLDVPLEHNGSSNHSNCTKQQRPPLTISSVSGEDSGYYGTETWPTSSSSYGQFSTRSSLGSVFSDKDDINLRKMSVDSVNSVTTGDINDKIRSNGSLQRRISRHTSTSFENRNSSSDFIGFINDNYQTATGGGSDGCIPYYRQQNGTGNESQSNPEMIRRKGNSGETLIKPNGRHNNNNRRAKLGLAVCITFNEGCAKDMERFCSEHVALLESMLCRLRASAETAYLNNKHFLQIMFHAWQQASNWAVDFFRAPRLTMPVWLTLTNRQTKNPKSVAEQFMNELCSLLSLADTKDTNFFVSTMLTAVLTNHLGWVSTVSALATNPGANIAEIFRAEQAKLLDVQKIHPYNAVWAQMTDLYGSVGNPPRISRTIVCGAAKHTLERILNFLTYFIRCNEVRQVTSLEIVEMDEINRIFKETQRRNVSPAIRGSSPSLSQRSGLSRSQTCTKSLSDAFYKEVMNDIPNVLVYRDAHLVQRELRIGNFLMDPGIERKKPPVLSATELIVNGNQLKEDSPSSDDGVMEAIEIDAEEMQNKLRLTDYMRDTDLSWIEPIKEGLSWEDLEKLQKGINYINRRVREIQEESSRMGDNYSDTNQTILSVHDDLDFPSKSNQSFPEVKITKHKNEDNIHASLSDLITANSVGVSERMMWGIEPIKEYVTFDEESHFEFGRKFVEKVHDVRNAPGVVFVLGDNEALVNIRKSNENLPKSQADGKGSIKNTSINNLSIQEKPKPVRSSCNHKKHSGVKFNFEEYPQIATNYMKNKNLDLTNYDFLDKSSKLELNNSSVETDAAGSTSIFPLKLRKSDLLSEEEECEFCAGAGTRVLQTPSNATELEFEADENNYPSSSGQDFRRTADEIPQEIRMSPTASDIKIIVPNSNENEDEKITFLEVPFVDATYRTTNAQMTGKQTKDTSFVPSVFVGVTDHYIPDVVLQGTVESSDKWEPLLKQDLIIASHSANILPTPAENIAVVADLSKWDVRIVSSQFSQALPNGSATSSSVGMSQLVSSMLETVHAMSDCGISAYECMSFLEDKLKELYLHSETLAAFLLATEFCSLNTLTTSLDISANDVPLLLAVASLHTPQVTKKYGVSSR